MGLPSDVGSIPPPLSTILPRQQLRDLPSRPEAATSASMVHLFTHCPRQRSWCEDLLNRVVTHFRRRGSWLKGEFISSSSGKNFK